MAKIAVTNEYDNKQVDVDFSLKLREGSVWVGVERIDVRKEKKYGIRLSVSAKMETEDWSLCQTLCAATKRNLNKIIGDFGMAGDWAPSVTASCFIRAESPKKILDSSAPECQEAVAKMVAALGEAFNLAVAEHEAAVAAKVDAHTASRIAAWVANQIIEEGEAACDYDARLKALNEERRAAIDEIAATKDYEADVRAGVNKPDSLKATERAIKTGLVYSLEALKAKMEHSGQLLFSGRDFEIKPEDLVKE